MKLSANVMGFYRGFGIHKTLDIFSGAARFMALVGRQLAEPFRQRK